MHRRVGDAEEEKLSQQCIFRSRLMSEETKDCFLNGFDGLQGSNQTIYAPICGSTLLHQTLLAMTVGESLTIVIGLQNVQALRLKGDGLY